MADHSSKTLLIDLCPEPRLNQTAYLRRAFSVDQRFEVLQVTDLKAGIAAAQKAESILIYFEVSKKEHIVNLIILLSALTQQIQKGLCRSIGFMLIPKGAEQIEAMLKQKGVTEVVSARTTEKGVLHKINRFYESIQLSTQKKRQLEKGVKLGSTSASVELVTGLNLLSDYWILQKVGDIKFRRETWMLNLIGPPPSLGKWELDRSLKTNGVDGWIWLPRKPAGNTKEEAGFLDANSVLREAMSKDQGRWVFWGNPPQFSTQTCLWLFVSRYPRLAWYPRDNPKAPLIKIGLDGLKLGIAKNSENTGKIVSEIQAMLTADVRFKKTAGKSNELDMSRDRSKKGEGLDFSNENDGGKSPQFDAEGASGQPKAGVEFAAPDFQIDFASSGAAVALKDSEEGQEQEGASLDYKKEKRRQAGATELDYTKADKGEGGSLLYDPEQKESGEASALDYRDSDGKAPDLSSRTEEDGKAPPAAQEGFFQDGEKKEDNAFSFGKLKNATAPLPGTETFDPDSPQKVPDFKAPEAGADADITGDTNQQQIESIGAIEEKSEPYDALFQELGFGLTLTPLVALANQAAATPAKFLDLFENQLSVEVAGMSVRRGQQFSVRFQVANASTPLDFTTRSRVMEIDTIDGKTLTVGLEIEPVDPALLERFLAVFQERQQHVTDFLMAAKGGR